MKFWGIIDLKQIWQSGSCGAGLFSVETGGRDSRLRWLRQKGESLPHYSQNAPEVSASTRLWEVSLVEEPSCSLTGRWQRLLGFHIRGGYTVWSSVILKISQVFGSVVRSQLRRLSCSYFSSTTNFVFKLCILCLCHPALFTCRPGQKFLHKLIPVLWPP